MTTWVLCANVAGRAYDVSSMTGILPGQVYTSMPADAKKFPTKRAANATAKRLTVGRTQHWIEQVEDAAN